ncbi:hypothetical protein MOX02_05460 [Methylobacterium oxalidis]|uniref:Uncharacterized protein n=1 Tax=Methylobacterium oxalidis TaxID=944322 RepID=A0A512IXP9_9HYPH|nr:hypothetical protein MOX02_05460 [Methylobacterium oxalidis]GLS67887.1 hypothetical protein GCM10007888_62720 [Methylobacterium oxalidis]
MHFWHATIAKGSLVPGQRRGHMQCSSPLTGAAPVTSLLLYYAFCAGVAAAIYYGFSAAVALKFGPAVRLADALRPIPAAAPVRSSSAGNENIVRTARHAA